MTTNPSSSKTSSKNEIIIAVATVTMAIAAVLSLVASSVVSYFQWTAIKEQIILTSDQTKLTADELHRAHRPWVSVLNSIKMIEPLTFDKNGAHIKIVYTTKNGGNSMATNTHEVWKLFVGSTALPLSMLHNIWFSGMDSMEEEIQKYGTVILPGDEFQTSQLVSAGDPSFSGKSMITVQLIGYVAYKDEFGVSHETELSWQYVTKQGNQFKPLGIIDGHFEVTGISSAN